MPGSLTPARAPLHPVDLDTFLRGLFAGLALRGRTRFRHGPGVLDEALRLTVQDLDKMRRRQRVEFQFRIAPRTLARPQSRLAQTLQRLQEEGVIRLPGPGEIDLVVTLDAERAKDVLRENEAMIDMANWAGRCFLRRHATARVHPLRRGLSRGPA